MTSPKTACVLGVVLCALCSTHPLEQIGEATACGNAWRYENEEHVRLVADAEDQLRKGRVGQAVLSAKKVLRRHVPDGEASAGVLRRAARIVAIGTVRINSRATADWRVRLVESAAILTAQAAEAPKSATLQTYLGEAYARLPERHSEALDILGTLAAQDRIVSPDGWAALARLRLARAHGDRSSAWPARVFHEMMAGVALTRCKRVTARSALCEQGSA